MTMSKEELTADEQSALEAMQSGTPAEEPEQAAEPEQEAEPEKVETAEPEQDGEPKDAEFKSSRSEDKPPEGYVPHGALHAERSKRKELEQRLAALEGKMDAPKDEEQPPQWVDPLVDPEGFRKYDEYRTRQLSEKIERQEQERQQQWQQQQRFEKAARLEAEFAQKTPDYQEAVQHLHQRRVTDLRAQGMSDAEVAAQIRQDANAVFDAAEQLGWNPAELLYQNAVRAGYTRKQAEAAASDADKIVALDAAQKATKGIGAAGGADQAGGLTAEKIADMSEDELRAVDPKEIARVLGG
jgi:hypothetical protein